MSWFRSTSFLERLLLVAGTAIWIAAAINPFDRSAWLLENMLLAVAVVWVIATHRKWRLTATSYLLIFAFFTMHVLGAHYTYSETPAGDWLKEMLATERNHYDRLVHFFFGLLLVSPFRNQVECATRLSPRGAWGVSILIITGLSTAYELVEWLTAEIVSPGDAAAFLGTQGDVFDSQKDTGLAILGAAFGLTVALIFRWSRARVNSRRHRNLLTD